MTSTRSFVLLSAIAGLVLSSGRARADGPAPVRGLEDFDVIVERNAFALKAAAPTRAAPAIPVAEREAPIVRLTGIASFQDHRWAFIVHEARGQAPKFLTLREGESALAFHVAEIDAEHGEVRLVIDGEDVILAFAEQDARDTAARTRERRFVEEHTRAHEELQRLERLRLEKSRDF